MDYASDDTKKKGEEIIAREEFTVYAAVGIFRTLFYIKFFREKRAVFVIMDTNDIDKEKDYSRYSDYPEYLYDDINNTYKSFKRSLRRNINDCLKKGIEVSQGSTEEDKNKIEFHVFSWYTKKHTIQHYSHSVVHL